MLLFLFKMKTVGEWIDEKTCAQGAGLESMFYDSHPNVFCSKLYSYLKSLCICVEARYSVRPCSLLIIYKKIPEKSCPELGQRVPCRHIWGVWALMPTQCSLKIPGYKHTVATTCKSETSNPFHLKCFTDCENRIQLLSSLHFQSSSSVQLRNVTCPARLTSCRERHESSPKVCSDVQDLP